MAVLLFALLQNHAFQRVWYANDLHVRVTPIRIQPLAEQWALIEVRVVMICDDVGLFSFLR
jgi:hypothetical protein